MLAATCHTEPKTQQGHSLENYPFPFSGFSSPGLCQVHLSDIQSLLPAPGGLQFTPPPSKALEVWMKLGRGIPSKR